MYKCQGYMCEKTAPPEMEKFINDSKSVTGWFCGNECFYHPLSGGVWKPESKSNGS